MTNTNAACQPLSATDQALLLQLQLHLDRHPADWAMRQHLADLAQRTGRHLYAGLQRLLIRHRKRPHPPTHPHPPKWLQVRGAEHAIYNWTWWARGKGGGEDPMSIIGERWAGQKVVYTTHRGKPTVGYHPTRFAAEASLVQAAGSLEELEIRLTYTRREDP